MIIYGFIIPPNGAQIDLLDSKSKKVKMHHAKYVEQYISDMNLHKSFNEYEKKWLYLHSPYCSKLDYIIRIHDWIKVGNLSPTGKVITLTPSIQLWKLKAIELYASLGYYIDYIDAVNY